MRTVGQRRERPISLLASGALLAEGARFNDELHRLPTGNTTFIPKGIYRFKTHEDAYWHQLDCLAKGMAKVAQERANGRTDEYCRPASLEDLKALIESLNQQQVDYLLIGGYALFVYGYHRTTTGIDVLVSATTESGAKVKAALMSLPDQTANDLKPELFTEGDNIRVADAFLIDIMLNACGETYDTLKQYAVTVDLEGIPVKTVSLEGLPRTIQTVRDKDMADRQVLERALSLLRAHFKE